MKNYKAIIYFNEHIEKMFIAAHCKSEAFLILIKIYHRKLCGSEIAIIIRDLSYEEEKIYEINDKY